MEDVPEHLWHWPTSVGQERLAKRFGLPIDSVRQDWEWIVADAERLDEFLEVLADRQIDDDQRVSLAEILMQCFDDHLVAHGSLHPSRPLFIAELEFAPDLHALTLTFGHAVHRRPPPRSRSVPRSEMS